VTDEQPSPGRLEQALAGTVHLGGRYRPFGELTSDDARARASELKEVGTWGPMKRVIPVAQAWGELAALLNKHQAASVAELDPATIVSYAEKLWVLAPEEGLI
jgi:hypothetical protein